MEIENIRKKKKKRKKNHLGQNPTVSPLFFCPFPTPRGLVLHCTGPTSLPLLTHAAHADWCARIHYHVGPPRRIALLLALPSLSRWRRRSHGHRWTPSPWSIGAGSSSLPWEGRHHYRAPRGEMRRSHGHRWVRACASSLFLERRQVRVLDHTDCILVAAGNWDDRMSCDSAPVACHRREAAPHGVESSSMRHRWWALSQHFALSISTCITVFHGDYHSEVWHGVRRRGTPPRRRGTMFLVARVVGGEREVGRLSWALDLSTNDPG
jgi:hypothetical protein